MPPVKFGHHLLDYLWEVGPVTGSASGPAPVTHQEILAWQQGGGIRLQPWEFRMLHALSVDYANELHRAEAPDCKPPWKTKDLKPPAAAVAERMRQSIRSMANT